MMVTIQNDEKSAKCTAGKYYEITGLIIRKPKESKDAFYDVDTPMFKNVCHKGHTSEAIVVTGNKIHLT